MCVCVCVCVCLNQLTQDQEQSPFFVNNDKISGTINTLNFFSTLREASSKAKGITKASRYSFYNSIVISNYSLDDRMICEG